MTYRTSLAAIACAGLLGAGCQGKQPTTEPALEEIAERLDSIVVKLEGLEQKMAGAPAPQSKKRRGPDPTATYKVPIGDANRRGPDDALVTIVEWSDFQCPYCRKVGPTLKQLEQEYGDKVRFVFMHNPLSRHPQAMPAALAAEAAGRQGKFWEMHDLLFANQRELTPENFATWARELGLDASQFDKDMKDPKLRKAIQDMQRLAMKLGAGGTPAVFVNGRFLPGGARPVEDFRKAVDTAMAEAQKLIDGGTPRAKVYATIIAKGRSA